MWRKRLRFSIHRINADVPVYTNTFYKTYCILAQRYSSTRYAVNTQDLIDGHLRHRHVDALWHYALRHNRYPANRSFNSFFSIVFGTTRKLEKKLEQTSGFRVMRFDISTVAKSARTSEYEKRENTRKSSYTKMNLSQISTIT